MRSITVLPDDPGTPQARKLLEQLDLYLIGLYPPESNHLLPVEALRQPEVTFLTGRVDEQVLGCGAFVNRDGQYAEIKRIFVLPEGRALGLGRRILDELESRIRMAGLTLARLETGIHQPEALRLFEKMGYRRCGPFGDYPDDPLSVFMEKDLK